MPNFLIALAVVAGGLWFIRKMARTPQAAMPAFMRRMGGAGILAFAGLLALRGNINAALPLALFGLGLIGVNSPFMRDFSWGRQKSSGQRSRVVTSLLAMELDHDSGTMHGEILAGPLKGRSLSALSDGELRQLYNQCKSASDHSQALFEAWLDRSGSDWRTRWQEQGAGGASSGGKMSKDEAFAVLGLKPGVSATDIKAAHRRLMKEFHPDAGGSDYLAAKINQAKDVLLGGL